MTTTDYQLGYKMALATVFAAVVIFVLGFVVGGTVRHVGCTRKVVDDASE